MDEKEIQRLLSEVADKHKAAITTEVKTAVAAAMIDKEFADEQLRKFKGICEEQGLKADTIKNLEEVIQKQGEKLRSMEANQEKKEETIEQIVEKHADKFKAISENGTKAAFKFTLPFVRKTQVTRAGVSSTTMAMRLTEIGQLPYRGLKMQDLFRHYPMDPSSNGVIRFYDQQAITRAAAPTAEAGTYPESAITWIERLVKLEKITDSIPVTKEAWKQVYFIQSEIDRLLNINLAIKEDSQLYSGSGVSPEISGVYTTALASGDFLTISASAPYANSVVTPNVFDLISSMRTQIMSASGGKQSKYVPDIYVMNPVDVLLLGLSKDSLGRYLFPPELVEKIGGMSLVESSAVTQGSLLVGDSRYGAIYDDGGINIEAGYINDQLVKGAQTLVAEKFTTLLIRNVDADAFLACSNIVTSLANIKSATV